MVFSPSSELERFCGGRRRVPGRGAPHERGTLINADDPAGQDVTRGPQEHTVALGVVNVSPSGNFLNPL
ncbi:hypothetical protein ACFX2A_018075 [Malus domestica]